MRQWLVQLTAGFLGRCGLDYHEADDLVDFAEHMNHTRITKRVSSDIVNTIIIEARKRKTLAIVPPISTSVWWKTSAESQPVSRLNACSLFLPKFQRPIQEQNCPKTGQNCTLIGQICAISPRGKARFSYKVTRFFGSQVPSGRMRRFLCLPVC